MKISTITCTLLGLILLSTSSVIADSKYFKYPPADATFSPGSSVRFLARETPDFDKKSTVVAKLYSESGEFVKVVDRFYGERDDDNLEFFYTIDEDILPGRYYVELSSEKDYDDTTRSYTFNIRDDSNRYGGYHDYPEYYDYNNYPIYPY
ncbi:hypothetical protein K501DRAFT_267708 [Backusella circina FSU 941]|nr:hypothetical protein K501DRAFT_267708 [Backusella circina FSU 941]